MELSYETQGTSTYLVYTVSQDVQLDMVSVGMLVNNRIPGLAQTVFTQMDRTRYIKYNISTKIPADQLFMSPINRQRFLGLINGIINAMLSAEEYMLDPGTILLELSQMYLDVRTGETVLICVPSEEREGKAVNLKDFIKRIMYDTSFDQSENCDYVTKIINYLNSSAGLVLEDFQEFIHTLAVEQPRQSHQQSRQDHPQPQQSWPQQEQFRPQSQQSWQQPSVQAALETGAAVQAADRPVPSIEASPRQQFAAPPIPGIAEQKMEFPYAPATPVPAAPELPTGEALNTESKQMSLMYLLRHYSKENAAAYKAQKANKEKKPVIPQHSAKGPQNPSPAGFVIPGAERDGQGMGAMPFESPEQSYPEPQPVAAPFAPPLTPQPIPQAAQPIQSFGETDYFPDSEDTDETAIMGVNQDRPQAVSPFLIRRKNNERIPVDKPVFRLGRSADFNDYAIIDNSYVGHSHCHLIIQNGEYFIQDDNSKNHTMVNGTVISPGQPVKIAHGYTISVANEEFEFKLF